MSASNKSLKKEGSAAATSSSSAEAMSYTNAAPVPVPVPASASLPSSPSMHVLKRTDSTAASVGVSSTIIRGEASRFAAQEAAVGSGVIFPWNRRYKFWWGFTVLATILTAFYETYQIAFAPGGESTGSSALLGYLLMAIFALDMAINFNLAFYDEKDQIVWDRQAIASNYLRGMFIIDFLAVFPFYVVALAISGEVGNDTSFTQYLGLLRLLRLLRLHRVKMLVDILQYSTKLSLMTLTLSRNFCFCLVWTHINACVFYFIARQLDFHQDDTWIGGSLQGTNGLERYTTSLYWSIVTFTTVGYGDFSPVNEIEQIFSMLYMLLNIIIQAWMIGSITLLIVKQDEKTGQYRDVMETLLAYARAHDFDYVRTNMQHYAADRRGYRSTIAFCSLVRV